MDKAVRIPLTTKSIFQMSVLEIGRERERILHSMRTDVLNNNDRGNLAAYYNLLGKELKRRNLGG